MKAEGVRGWCDSHCHLDYLVRRGEDVAEIMLEAGVLGVERCVTIGTRVDKYDEVKAVSEGVEGVYRSVGQHPCYVAEEGVVSEGDLAWLCEEEKVVAVGETGLDYFRTREHEGVQKESFENHIRVAIKRDLPLVIHSRSSGEDMLRWVEEGKSEGDFLAIWHCFDGDRGEAERALDLGMMLSFSGILTYKKSGGLREIASNVPRERLLIETDSPYLSPEPMRGKMNKPSHVVHTGKVLALCCGVSEEEMRGVLWENTHRVFWRMKGGGL